MPPHSRHTHTHTIVYTFMGNNSMCMHMANMIVFLTKISLKTFNSNEIFFFKNFFSFENPKFRSDNRRFQVFHLRIENTLILFSFSIQHYLDRVNAWLFEKCMEIQSPLHVRNFV